METPPTHTTAGRGGPLRPSADHDLPGVVVNERSGVSLPAKNGASAKMAVYPCCQCRQRKPGKLATAYWAWFVEDQTRRAYRWRVCAECAGEAFKLLLAAGPGAGSENAFACIACGSDAKDDSSPIYCTLFLPKQDAMEYALQLDTSCAAKLRALTIEHGELLPDRGGVVGGPPHSDTVWAGIASELSGAG